MKAIVEKIQKLLSLANSDNENEAKLAASKAQELLVKYNLTEAQVDGHDSSYVREDLVLERTRADKSVNYVLMIIRDYFFVQVIRNPKWVNGKKYLAYTLLGKAHNVEIAIFVKTFLDQAFVNLWAEYRIANNADARARSSYVTGLYLGLVEQLKASREKVQTETGLVLVKDNQLEEFIKKQFQNLRGGRQQMTFNDREALEAGREQGRNLRIAKGLGGASTNSGLRLGSGK
jgi:hypothetical protein